MAFPQQTTFQYTHYWPASQSSSSVSSVWYNQHDEAMAVEFQNNTEDVYTFENVEYDLYLAFKEAASAGKFFSQNLRNWTEGGDKLVSSRTTFAYVPPPVFGGKKTYDYSISYSGERTIIASTPEEALRLFRLNHPNVNPTHINLNVELTNG